MTAASAEFAALGTTAHLTVLDARALADAISVLRGELEQLDLVASRFRADSELTRLNALAGCELPVSARMVELLSAALEVADSTAGAVDPTVGAAVRHAGYDREFARIGAAEVVSRRPAPHSLPGWRTVELDRERRRCWMPAGTHLDLGATAKAWAADRVAGLIARRFETGTLVSLGGDLAVAGPAPAGGWRVGVADDHRTPLDGVTETVAIESGGLATSSTSVRRWRIAGGGTAHHLMDPRTALPAVSPWRTVSVHAARCLDANAAATAAIVRGRTALSWLAGLRLPARLVAADGAMVRIGGWPEPVAG